MIFSSKFKNILTVFTALLIMISLFGCMSLFESEEDKLFTEKMNDLISAINAGNADRVKYLLSKSAINADSNIDSDIDKLISIYPDDSEVFYDGLLTGNYQTEGGKQRSAINATINIASKGEYYWLYIELVYEDDFCPDNVGISSVYLFTADEYCAYYHSEDSEPLGEMGVTVLSELKLKNDVKCIQGFPHEWMESERNIQVSEVEEFLKSYTKLSDFISKYGDANATDEDGDRYYEIVDGDGDVVYLKLGVENGQIIYADVLDEFKFLRAIIEEQPSK